MSFAWNPPYFVAAQLLFLGLMAYGGLITADGVTPQEFLWCIVLMYGAAFCAFKSLLTPTGYAKLINENDSPCSDRVSAIQRQLGVLDEGGKIITRKRGGL